jgi:hypothetical protein
MRRLVLLLLAAGAAAAEPAPPKEVTLAASISGRASRVVATVPAGFTSKVTSPGGLRAAVQTLQVDSADQRIRLMLTLIPPGEKAPRTAAELERTLRESCDLFAKEAVEGETRPFPLKLADGLGVAATLTDKREVGRPTPKGPEHWKVMTIAMARVGEANVVCTLFHDSAEQAELPAARAILEGLRPAK